MLGKRKALGLPGMTGSELEAAKGPPPPSAKGKHWSLAAGMGGTASQSQKNSRWLGRPRISLATGDQ